MNLSRIMEALRREHPVRVWQWLTMWIVLLTILFGGIYGLNRSIDSSRHDAAHAVYEAELAAYMNARDEVARCQREVAVRAGLRGVIDSIVEAIDNPQTHATVLELRVQFERDFPALHLEDCPPEPVLPVPPH